MPYIPPFRTRRGPQIEPHFGDPDDTGHESEPAWAPLQPAPADAADRQAAAPGQGLVSVTDKPARGVTTPGVTTRAEIDDETIPVLTRLIEPAKTARAETLAPGPGHEALVARITDEVLDALQPALQTLVSDAVRRALASHAPPGDDT